MTDSTTPATLIEALHGAAAAATPLGFLDRRERLAETSWREVREHAVTAAAGLVARGLEPGDRVGLIYPTGPDFLHAFFAVLLAGAVPVPLYPPVRLGRVDEYRRRTTALLDRVEARALLADPRARRILEPAEGGPSLPLGGHEMGELSAGVGRVSRASLSVRSHQADPRDLALVQFSSGTTSDPKPVALSHRALMAQVAALNHFWPGSDEVEHAGLSWLPLYHDMGLVGCVLAAVARPGRLTLMPPELFVARPAAWLRAISRCRATVSPAPTFAFGQCVERVRDDELEGVDLSSWRYAFCGAETVVPEVLDRFAERFSRWGFRREALIPGYGLAESALAVTISEPDAGPRSRTFLPASLADSGPVAEDAGGLAISSLGRPLPGFAIEVRGTAGAPLGRGEVGRIWVSGPSLMDGYLDDPEATARALVDGWLDTGDLGFVLDGELFLTGRARDVLILRGRNHAPEEVERVVERVPGVAPGGAAAVSHLAPGAVSESLWILVETRREIRGARPVGVAELEEACRREVLSATGLAADEIVVLAPGGLPRTSSGKIRRRAALDQHLLGGSG